MWYVVEAKSKYTGNWYYVKGYRTKVSALKLVGRIKVGAVRVNQYSSAYEREHDPAEGKVVFQRGEGVYIS